MDTILIDKRIFRAMRLLDELLDEQIQLQGTQKSYLYGYSGKIQDWIPIRKIKWMDEKT